MRTLPSEISTYLQENAGIVVRQLLWVAAKNRTTGVYEYIGFWSGEDHQIFTVDGEPRTYYGSGQFLNWGELSLESTLNIRKLSATVTAISPEMQTVIRQYEPKMAPTELHLAFFSPESNNLVASPLRVHKGWIDKFTITTPAVNEQGQGRLDLMGHTRIMTRTLPTKRSEGSQKKRNPSDTFYNDVSITGQITTPWGAKI